MRRLIPPLNPDWCYLITLSVKGTNPLVILALNKTNEEIDQALSDMEYGDSMAMQYMRELSYDDAKEMADSFTGKTDYVLILE